MLDLKSYVIGIVMMIRKFTPVNIKLHEEPVEADFINGIMLLPIMGLAIGFFASFIASFKIFYDGFLIGTLVFLYYCIATKNVNLTEFYRTLNYIIKPQNSIEQISGIIGTVIISVLYISLFRLVNVEALIVMGTSGYSGLIILSTLFQRNKEGTAIMKHCSKYHKASAFIISFTSAVLLNYKLVIPLALTYMISGLIVSNIDERVKVIPSSVEGFIIEITQILFLMITYIFKII